MLAHLVTELESQIVKRHAPVAPADPHPSAPEAVTAMYRQSFERPTRVGSQVLPDGPAKTSRRVVRGPNAAQAAEVHRHPLLTPHGQAGWLYSSSPVPVQIRRSALAIGQFDGVHQGHQALIMQLQQRAAGRNLAVGAITFDRHPMTLLAPEKSPPFITTLDEKVERLIACGLDFVAVLTVTEGLLQTTPEQFVDEVLVAALGAQSIAVGTNFRFGHRAAGTPELLTDLGMERGFEVAVPDLTQSEDAPISSTRIRSAIIAGHLEHASDLLGRSPRLVGQVLDPKRNRFRLGLPANVAIPTSGSFIGKTTTRTRTGKTVVRHALIEVDDSRVYATTSGLTFSRLLPGDEAAIHLERRAPLATEDY